MIIFKIVTAVAELGNMTIAQKSIMYTLAIHCKSPDGKGIYLSLTMLAYKACMNERTVRIALKQLQEAGYIEEERERKDAVKGYKLCLVKLGLTLEDTKVSFQVNAPGVVDDKFSDLPELPELPAWQQNALATIESADFLFEEIEEAESQEKEYIAPVRLSGETFAAYNERQRAAFTAYYGKSPSDFREERRQEALGTIRTIFGG